MDTLLQDLRHGLRMLAKNPSFTMVAVLTLALGIGINASVFSLMSGLLLRRPPVHDPDRLTVIVATNPARGPDWDRSPVSVPEFVAWREQAQSFAGMAAANNSVDFSLTGQGEPERLSAQRVTANYFRVIGVSAEAGRAFSPDEDQGGHDHVVVLSHDLWHRRFGTDRRLMGKTITLNGESYTVIGVMPSEFKRALYPGALSG